MNGKCYEVKISREPVFARNIARIKFCGITICCITDRMDWTQPTPEQIKALHDTFCIDVEILGY